MALFNLFKLPYVGLCVGSFLFAAFALYLFHRKRERSLLIVLFFAAISIRLFMAYQNPFLHPWDERIHALVAKNMMSAPFTPMLKVNPIDGYDPYCWLCNHVWLHKQPLFLWQMALSMKIFGVSEYAVRYPSVLMGSIMVVLLYSTAKRVTGNRSVAMVAALLLCFNNFQLEFISGLRGMEHNDVAFGFYVLASIWAYVRYTENKKLSWAVLVGFFAGCAVLTKWLTDLVVFGGWGLNILLSLQKKQTRRDLSHILIALLVSVAVFLPWQLYVFHRFPLEAAYEMKYNSRHITEVIEGHCGTNFFYIDNFDSYFGEVGWFFVPAGLMLLALRIRRRQVAKRPAAIALMAIFTAVFIFFSYIVVTKIHSYLFVVAPIGLVFIAIATVEIRRFIGTEGYPRLGGIVFFFLVLVITISILNPELIAKYHDPNDRSRQAFAKRTQIYKRLDHLVPANTAVIINIVSLEEFCAMFYHTRKIIIAPTINDHTIDSLTRASATVAAFRDREEYKLPQRLRRYAHTFLIREQLQ